MINAINIHYNIFFSGRIVVFLILVFCSFISGEPGVCHPISNWSASMGKEYSVKFNLFHAFFSSHFMIVRVVFGLWQFAWDKFYMRWKSDWWLLCRFGNVLPNVSCMHNWTIGWANGHQILVLEWYSIWSRDPCLWTCRWSWLYQIGAILLLEFGIVWEYDGTNSRRWVICTVDFPVENLIN